MQLNAQVEITGVKCFLGNIEGVAYDSTTLFVRTDLDESRENACGYATTEYKYGTSAEYAKLAPAILEAKKRGLPFLADVVLELTTTGRKDNKRILEVHPVIRGHVGSQAAGLSPPSPSNPLKA